MPFLSGKVTAVQDQKIQIAFQTTSKCEQTATACAHQPTLRLFPSQSVWFDFQESCHVGDNVIVSLPNSSYQRLLLRLYGLPLLALWLGAGLFETLGYTPLWSITGSLTLAFALWRLNFAWSIPKIHIQKLKD